MLLGFRLALIPVAAVADDAPAYASVTALTPLKFPADFGSHPDFRTEWWYVTGWLKTPQGEPLGFQITFFRSKPAIDDANPSAFAPHQLLIAHCAISDPKRGRLWQDQRIRRAGLGLAEAAEGDTNVWIDRWSLKREAASLCRENCCGGFLAGSRACRNPGPAAQRRCRHQPQRTHAAGGELLLQPAAPQGDR